MPASTAVLQTSTLSKKRRRSVISLTPLIDVVFILLVFFMVPTSFVQESGLEITRPESAFAQREVQGF